MIIGLTGGIASGKSTVSAILKELGIKVVDADIIAREVMDSQRVLKEVAKKFGNETIDDQGKLARKKLREIVFASKEKVRILNSIVHPLIVKRLEEEKEILEKNRELTVFDIPLLFEMKLDYLCDRTILVHVDKETQIKRVMTRDKSSREDAQNIIGNQMSLEEKLKRADIIVENNDTLESLRATIKKVLDDLKNSD